MLWTKQDIWEYDIDIGIGIMILVFGKTPNKTIDCKTTMWCFLNIYSKLQWFYSSTENVFNYRYSQKSNAANYKMHIVLLTGAVLSAAQHKPKTINIITVFFWSYCCPPSAVYSKLYFLAFRISEEVQCFILESSKESVSTIYPVEGGTCISFSLV